MGYNSLNQYLRRQFGCKVYKLALSSGCGCPNRDGTLGTGGCIFCDGAGTFAAAGDIPTQLRYARALVSAKAGPEAKYIAYFQSFTNTYGPVERLETLYRQAQEPEDIVALSIATRPDCLGPEVMAMLARLAAVKPLWVELGLQTIHQATADYIRRGFDLPVYDQAVKKLHNIGAQVVTHQILGLPGENKAQMVDTARYIGTSGADGIKLHLLHVLRGTDLTLDYEKGLFSTLELEEYIDILEDCIRVLPESVVIHRLTGDGAKQDLIAPLWSADKKRVLNAINRAFSRDAVVQGSDVQRLVSCHSEGQGNLKIIHS